MTKQPGRQMLVKIGDGQESEAFDILCGLTTKTMTINNNNIDVTTADCVEPGGQLWRQLMTGIRSVAVSGNGYFQDTDTEDRLRAVALGTGATDTGDAIANFQIIVPHFGTFEGPFHVDSIEYGGEQENGVTYSLSLASAGPVVFTAAA